MLQIYRGQSGVAGLPLTPKVIAIHAPHAGYNRIYGRVPPHPFTTPASPSVLFSRHPLPVFTVPCAHSGQAVCRTRFRVAAIFGTPISLCPHEPSPLPRRAGSRWEPITGAAQLAVPAGRWAARRLNYGHLKLESSSCSADLIDLFETDAQIHTTPRFSSSVGQLP
ncbi:unnamed protein product [Pleuronectes platessa]|uniref:Uncharacterized protein n=1 Tax=Pleuronectes platessa TaxID=8262 RepID=A0A9N7VB57_PLEPL|nr:unnamed protein product [Pleuronectes platessa]